MSLRKPAGIARDPISGGSSELRYDASNEKPTAKHQRNETLLVQRIDQSRKSIAADSGPGLNWRTKKSIHRVVFESSLDIRNLRQVAAIFQVPERKVLASLRETVREAIHHNPTPTSRGGIVVPLKRVA